jgi:transitional endoplasmic reticulum ATPase
MSKWFGESENEIAHLFLRARQVAPSVVFIDEIDSLVPRRGSGESSKMSDGVVNALLSEIDGLDESRGVVVLGATNQPMLIDPALLRPGRFDELIYVPIPDRKTRRHILDIHLRRMPCAADVDLDELADKTQGYTGADLENLARRAGMLALRVSLDVMDVPMPVFRQALKDTQPSVTPKMEAEYAKAADKLRSARSGFRTIGFTTK